MLLYDLLVNRLKYASSLLSQALKMEAVSLSASNTES